MMTILGILHVGYNWVHMGILNIGVHGQCPLGMPGHDGNFPVQSNFVGNGDQRQILTQYWNLSVVGHFIFLMNLDSTKYIFNAPVS